jgi:AhpD family alkylhydroperoxidase
MPQYPVHTIESAPEQSRPALEGLQQNFGRIPNLAATMATAPPLVNSFVAAFANFHGGTFDNADKQVLLLTNAVTNECAWAVAFHSTLALGEGVSADDVQRIRDGANPSTPRFAALSRLTRTMIERRGHLGDEDRDQFIAAGFNDGQVLEVIAGVAVSTMANYAGNVTNPPLEPVFQAQAWKATTKIAAV